MKRGCWPPNEALPPQPPAASPSGRKDLHHTLKGVDLRRIQAARGARRGCRAALVASTGPSQQSRQSLRRCQTICKARGTGADAHPSTEAGASLLTRPGLLQSQEVHEVVGGVLARAVQQSAGSYGCTPSPSRPITSTCWCGRGERHSPPSYPEHASPGGTGRAGTAPAYPARAPQAEPAAMGACFHVPGVEGTARARRHGGGRETSRRAFLSTPSRRVSCRVASLEFFDTLSATGTPTYQSLLSI